MRRRPCDRCALTDFIKVPNDPNDFKVFNTTDAIKKIAENFAGGGILLTLYPEGIFVDRSRLLGAFLHRYGCFRKTNTTFSISRAQSRTCSGYAEARKGRKDFNDLTFSVSVMLLRRDKKCAEKTG